VIFLKSESLIFYVHFVYSQFFTSTTDASAALFLLHNVMMVFNYATIIFHFWYIILHEVASIFYYHQQSLLIRYGNVFRTFDVF